MKVYAKPLGKNKLNHNRAIEIPIPNSITCSHCNIPHEKLEPERSFYNNDSDITDVCLECPEISFLIYRCPECQKVFYVHINCKKREIISYYPPLIEHHEFPPNIHEKFSRFTDMYKEAETAEHSGLTLICGAGYRRAFEFLIREYLISFVENKDKIAELPLAQCIKKLPTDENNDFYNTRKYAKVSAWLGNDQVHYTSLHPDFDLKDLKSFIIQTANCIDNHISVRSRADELFKQKSTKGD